MNDFRRQLAKIKHFIGEEPPKEVTFYIGSEEESYVQVGKEKMSYDRFTRNYPHFKPKEIEVIVGEWHE